MSPADGSVAWVVVDDTFAFHAEATAFLAGIRARVAELEADLAAARTSLRRMIRDENRPATATGA